MIPEIDVWRSAQLMIRQYGDAAVTEQGDSAGALVWRRIREAIDQLQNDTSVGPAH